MRVRRSGKEQGMTNKELADYLRTTCPGRKDSRRSAELEAELKISGNERGAGSTACAGIPFPSAAAGTATSTPLPPARCTAS